MTEIQPSTAVSLARRVAILGGSGFVGRNIQEALGDSGATVGIFSRRTGCDLLELPSAVAALRDFRPTHLINCAAVVGSVNYVSDFPADVADVNARLVLNVYQLARLLTDVVLINVVANCVYPDTLEVFEEDRIWNGPLHPSVESFGGTRRFLLVLAECYRAQYGVRSVNLIAPNMYGPGDSMDPNKTHAFNALILKFTAAVRLGLRRVDVWGTGRPVREWLYVKDLGAVIRHVIESGDVPVAPVNIAQRRGYSVDELVGLIAAVVGYDGSIIHDASYGDGAPSKVMDDVRFRRWLPDFHFTGISTGILETREYYDRISGR